MLRRQGPLMRPLVRLSLTRRGSAPYLNEFDVLTQELVDEGGEFDALGLSELGEGVLDVVVQVDGQARPGTRPMKLPRCSLGEIDLRGHVVVARAVRLGLASHRDHLRCGCGELFTAGRPRTACARGAWLRGRAKLELTGQGAVDEPARKSR
jgi:hypothetical protein